MIFAFLSNFMHQLRNNIKLLKLRAGLSTLVSTEVPLFTKGLFLHKVNFKYVASLLYRRQ